MNKLIILVLSLIIINILYFNFNKVSAQEEHNSVSKVGYIQVEGSINPGSSDYILKSLKWAEHENLEALLIKLDTPGGLLSSTRDIVKGFLNSKIPIIVYVGPSGSRAGSAGVFITMAGHIAAMAEGTNIGAAHPVTAGGKNVKEDSGSTMEDKVTNDAAAFIESIAKMRGRNVEWGIKAVRDSDSIPSKTALDKKVIDIIANSIDELLEAADGKTVKVNNKEVILNLKNAFLIKHEMSFKQKIINVFADPNIAYFLMMIGMLGIMMEFYHPGTIFPGVIGGICLILAFISFQVLPINYGALVLILLAIGLLVAEVFIPSFGILGIGGTVSLVLGSIMLFDGVNPDFMLEPSFGISLYTIIPVTALIVFFMLFVGYLVVKSQKLKIVTGKEGLIGEQGKVIKTITKNEGTIHVHGEYWKAESDAIIEKNTIVTVMSINGLKLKVIKQNSNENT